MKKVIFIITILTLILLIVGERHLIFGNKSEYETWEDCEIFGKEDLRNNDEIPKESEKVDLLQNHSICDGEAAKKQSNDLDDWAYEDYMSAEDYMNTSMKIPEFYGFIALTDENPYPEHPPTTPKILIKPPIPPPDL